MRISLEFDESHNWQCRARLGYAFQVFCAQYGHEPLLDAAGGEFCISYRALSDCSTRPRLLLSSSYQVRPLHLPASPPIEFEQSNERTALHYVPTPGTEPDWLAEIFEWLSCADEYSVSARDGAGRIPFLASYTGRHHLNPQLPYAAVAMRMLQRAICRIASACPEEPSSPAPELGHIIVNTHDVDFLPVSRKGTVFRVLKNGLIALFQKAPGLMSRQRFRYLQQCHPHPSEMFHALLTAVAGRSPADEIGLLLNGELTLDVGASYYFICAHRHRRDGNYHLEDSRLPVLLRSLEEAGQEVGLHGSYCSLNDPESLSAEYETLRNLGFHSRGGRQHWLRFTLDRLIPALESAGAAYDCSLGWSNVMGYRAGACFAFPLYNFTEERASRFLEIPLVMMEQCLCAANQPYAAATSLLDSSRKYGWGGVSVLWHPSAFDGGQLPISVGRAYWDLLNARHELHDNWVSAQTFLNKVQSRYINVGLLPEERIKQCQLRNSIPA
jgi:hypothetical protein